jgi:sec-independent protein translocase protein TatC
MLEKEMTFLDHLEALRRHLLRALLVTIVVTIVFFSFGSWVFEHIILAPARLDFWTYKKMCEIGTQLNIDGLCIKKLNFSLMNRTLAGQFVMHITFSLILGVVVSFPYIFFEIWRFVRPALYDKEQSVTQGVVFFVSLLFTVGSLFGYYIIAPISINFLSNYTLDTIIENQIDVGSYVSTLSLLVLGCAILFQLPMCIYFLAKVGIVNAAFLRKYRRHSIVVIMILAAVLTPSPDMFTQLIVAMPMVLLYEIGIFIAKYVEKQLPKAEEMAEDIEIITPEKSQPLDQD